jgi:colanic acid/amylovoran biosynthesis glycosyltransferase
MVGHFPVVSEQFILNHIVGLIDGGHEVTILAVNEGDMDRVQPMVRDYQLIDRTVFARLPRSSRARFVEEKYDTTAVTQTLQGWYRELIGTDA